MIEVLPEVGAAAGYMVGQGAEQIALHTIKRSRGAMLGSHEGANLGRHQGKLHRLVAQLALVGAMAGFAYGHAAEPQEAHVVAPAELTVVADHSFDTSLDGGAARIDTIGSAFADTDQLNVQGIVAHNGGNDPIKLDKLAKDHPYGPSSLETTVPVAMGEAFNNSTPARSNVLGTGDSRNAGVLVLTDNDSIGPIKTVVKRARQDGNLPIFVANASEHPDKQITKELQAEAKETGGQYWDASANAETVAEAIKHDIKPHEITANSDSNDRAAWLLAGIALTGIAALQFFRRKGETAIS